MRIKQAELKKFTPKTLVSLDRVLHIQFEVNFNEENEVNLNELANFLKKPLILEVKEDVPKNLQE